MRKLKFGLALLACMAMACGEESSDEPTTGETPAPGANDNTDTGTKTDGEGNGTDTDTDPSTGEDPDISIPDDQSSGGDPYPECPREMVQTPPPYEGETPVWTQEQFMACQQKCGQDQTCYTEENCPGMDKFNECANSAIFACSAASDGACRTEYENVVCCINLAGCAGDDLECAQNNCGGDITAMQTCIQNDVPCLQSAVGGCIGPDAAGGDTGAGDGTDGSDTGAGAGTDDGTGAGSIPAQSLQSFTAEDLQRLVDFAGL